MNGENFNRQAVKMRVLVAPLDWGLGHATRCIPLVKELIIRGFEVLIASDGDTASLLKSEFPKLIFLSLKGYNVKYSRSRKMLAFTIFGQIPRLLKMIRYEHIWLKKAVRENGIDAVISDNRPGLFLHSIPCIYITHQLNIKTGNVFTAKLAQRLHYHYINKFTECWVPDAEGEINLGGDLSHPLLLPKVPVKYLGPLSRFEKNSSEEKKYDLLIMLSGPEPQRTIFEKKILQQLQNYIGKVLLVRGLPAQKTVPQITNETIEHYNHLSSAELNTAIEQSKMIISRSGYTTVMDLAKLQLPAVLVPTPGQTEQEYLADYLMEKKMFYCVSQDKFDLQEVIKKVEKFAFSTFAIPETYSSIVKEWQQRL